MTKTAEDAQTSHGKHSNLWKDLNTRLIEEAALVGYPRAVITWMMAVQGCGKLLHIPSDSCLS
jgi:hypothetical protein